MRLRSPLRPLCSLLLGPAVLALLAGCQKADTANPVDGAGAVADGSADEAGTDDDSEGAAATAEPEEMLTVTIFEETVQGQMQDVLDCYAEAQAKDSKIAGKLKANFVVDADGKVTEVTALEGSTLTDEGMLLCIQTRAAAWGLPRPPTAPTNFSFPFELVPAG